LKLKHDEAFSNVAFNFNCLRSYAMRRNLFCFLIGRADAKVDWVHVDNLCHANVCAATAPQEDAGGQAFFISDGHPINNWEFLRPFAEGLG